MEKIDLSTLKPGDRVKFRCGGEAVVDGNIHHDTEWTYWNSLCYRHGGKYQCQVGEHPFDIIEIIPKREPIVGYFNVYENGMWAQAYTYRTKKCADENAAEHRLSVLKITYDPDTKTAGVEIVG